MRPSVRRPSRAEVSTSALTHNLRVLQDLVAPSGICAVVKANGYGHGAPEVARVLDAAGVAMLAVATVDEGVELRDAGCAGPILLLAELPAAAMDDALDARLTVTVSSRASALAVAGAAHRRGGRHPVHLKVDTGLHRLGTPFEDVADVATVLRDEPAIDLAGCYTHFAVADGPTDEDRAFTERQFARFGEALSLLEALGVRPAVVHADNSAGALNYPGTRGSMVRIGLALYGYLPRRWMAPALGSATLRPVLTLRSAVVATRRVAAGERPGYGRPRPVPGPSTIATIPFGYADGYPRRLFEAGGEVLIGGVRYPLAGTVSMDMLVVDCGDGPVAVGDEVVLLGRQGDQFIGADDWADWGGTIPWEILCGIGPRVPRVVVD